MNEDRVFASIQQHNIQSISVIGLSKNAGKTTALQALSDAARERGITVGLCSIGVDGEKHDVWSGKPKPPVRVSPGQYVATIPSAYAQSSAQWRIIDRTPIRSVLGEIFIGQCTRAGDIMLAGSHTTEAIRTIRDRLRSLGAGLCLVDGAYDRAAAASPVVTDGMLFVAGAHAAPDPDQVVQQTERWLYPYRLERAQLPDSAKSTIKAGSHNIWLRIDGQGETHPFAWEEETTEGDTLLCPGALTMRQWRLITELKKPPTVVIQDPTRCFVPMEEARKGLRQGIRLCVLNPVVVIGICINPYSPDGYEFDPVQMQETFVKRFDPIPVMNAARMG